MTTFLVNLLFVVLVVGCATTGAVEIGARSGQSVPATSGDRSLNLSAKPSHHPTVGVGIYQTIGLPIPLTAGSYFEAGERDENGEVVIRSPFNAGSSLDLQIGLKWMDKWYLDNPRWYLRFRHYEANGDLFHTDPERPVSLKSEDGNMFDYAVSKKYAVGFGRLWPNARGSTKNWFKWAKHGSYFDVIAGVDVLRQRDPPEGTSSDSVTVYRPTITISYGYIAYCYWPDFY